MTRATRCGALAGAVVVVALVGLTACTQEQRAGSTSEPVIEEKIMDLKPASASVKAGVITAELQEMKVRERVERASGRIVDPPVLRATLKLTNTSRDTAVRPVGGKIEYVDTEGKAIPLAQERGEPTFTYHSYQERLDPGSEGSQVIDLPFPVAALKEKKLQEIRMELAYIPTPYKEETVSIRVAVPH